MKTTNGRMAYEPYRQLAEDAIAAARAELPPGEDLPYGREHSILVKTVYSKYFGDQIERLRSDLAEALDLLDQQRTELDVLRPLGPSAETIAEIRDELERVKRQNARLLERDAEMRAEIDVRDETIERIQARYERDRSLLQKQVRDLEDAARERFAATERAT